MPRARLGMQIAFIGVVVLLASAINFSSGFPIHGGSDLRGGFQVAFQARFDPGTPDSVKQDLLQQAADVITNRANGLGVSEVSVQTQGADRILVAVPGAHNPDEVIKTLRETGALEWIAAGDQPIPIGSLVTTSTGPPSPAQIRAATGAGK